MTGTILTHIVAIIISDRDGCKIYKGCLSYETVKAVYILRFLTKWCSFRILASPLPFVLRKSKPLASTTSLESNGSAVGRVITLNPSVPTPVSRTRQKSTKSLLNFTAAPTDELIDRKEFEEKLNQIAKGSRKGINCKKTLEIEADNIKEKIMEIWKFSAEVIERFVFVCMSMIIFGYFAYYMIRLIRHAKRQDNLCYKYYPWNVETGEEKDAEWITDTNRCLI